MKASGRLRKKAIYSPLCQQALEAVLRRELINNFGFENMGVVADVLIQRFLAIIEEYAPLQKRLRPYQTLLLAVQEREVWLRQTDGELSASASDGHSHQP